MTTNTDPASNPNPGDGVKYVAANPDDPKGTDPAASEGQGNGDTAAAPTGEGTGDGQPTDPAGGAPDEYAAFDLPDGYALEGDRLTEASEFFKANNMTQEQAQNAVSLFVKMDQQNQATLADKTQQGIEQAREQQRETWLEQAKAELGDGYEAAVQKAYLAVQSLGSEKLKEALNEQGWGNHPELIKAFSHFGGLLSEGGMDTGRPAGTPARDLSLADRMYPTKA